MANPTIIKKYCEKHNISWSEELHAQRFVIGMHPKRIVLDLEKFGKISNEDLIEQIALEILK